MKFHATLFAALVGFTAQAYAASNPLNDALVEQDIHTMQSLGEQYHLTGKAINEAWDRKATAEHQGNFMAAAVAKEQLAFYRFVQNETTAALVTAKAKLSADIKTESVSPRSATVAVIWPEISKLTLPGSLGLF